jgi:L-seryl-tRNA(Ser) seleniumtransferase
MANRLAGVPAIHRILADRALRAARAQHGASAVRAAARAAVAAVRGRIVRGEPVPPIAEIVHEVEEILARRSAPAFPEVINATGVIIHTNLGRAPRLAAELSGYLALEYDLAAGERGERLAPVVERLCRYFGAEAATVLTNNAAALVLLLAAHAAGREVVVSRGELIEIGGSFRLPEIMSAAGARLVEVGCTNRTRLADYTRVIGDDSAAILVVHRSNFHLEGFVATPDLRELIELGHAHHLPVWVDEGSGCHLDLSVYGLRRERTVHDILRAGADAVLFSGDKLLGGPQAGIVLGSEATVASLRRHPLRRALRPDKGCLTALATTLDAYLEDDPEVVPLYRLLSVPVAALRARARRVARRVGEAGAQAEVVASRAVLGGGTTPDQTLPSWAVALPGGAARAAELRGGRPPVIARIEADRVVLDLRAVFPEQDRELIAAILAQLPA